METKKEEIKKEPLVIIDFILNKYRITGRNAQTLSAKYKGAEKREAEWLNILKENEYIS